MHKKCYEQFIPKTWVQDKQFYFFNIQIFTYNTYTFIDIVQFNELHTSKFVSCISNI